MSFYPLFKHIADEHGLTLLDSELHEIVLKVAAIQRFQNYDLVAHVERHKAWSARTFGPGAKCKGVCEHIREELVEIEKVEGKDLEEWIDVIILALDGAWRNGASAAQVAEALEAKMTKNENRKWPDWRTCEEGKPINHIREGEPVTDDPTIAKVGLPSLQHEAVRLDQRL